MDKTQDFINKAIKIYGNDKYDYSKVEYKNAKSKVIIICKLHDIEFLQAPTDHISLKQGSIMILSLFSTKLLLYCLYELVQIILPESRN